MLQNKIYQNFIKEIIKTFLVILFGLTAIAWTVRAVNFLDLVVDDGFAIMTYFQYSILNIFGILTKLNLIQISGMLGLIYFSWAIGQFFEKKKIINYLKSLAAYILGFITFGFLAIILGVLLDQITKH